MSTSGTIEVNPHRHFLRPNLRLEGVWGSRYHHFTRAVAVLQNSDVDFSAVISHVLPLERVAEGFDALDGGYELDGKTAFKIAVRGCVRRGCGLEGGSWSRRIVFEPAIPRQFPQLLSYREIFTDCEKVELDSETRGKSP